MDKERQDEMDWQMKAMDLYGDQQDNNSNMNRDMNNDAQQ